MTIQEYNAETKRLYEKKLSLVVLKGGFLADVPPDDVPIDFDTDAILDFFTSRQEGLLEVVKAMLEGMKKVLPDAVRGSMLEMITNLNTQSETIGANNVLSQAQEMLKTKE